MSDDWEGTIVEQKLHTNEEIAKGAADFRRCCQEHLDGSRDAAVQAFLDRRPAPGLH